MYTSGQPSECFLGIRKSQTSLSLLQATVLLSSISLGLLLATASLCWFTVGWALGFISVIMGIALQIQSSSALMRAIFSKGCYSYEDIALVYFGKKFQTLVNILLIVGQSSVCIGALYVSSTSLLGFIDQLFKSNPAWLSYELCVVMSGVILLPFSIKKEIKGVKVGSIINITLVLAFIVSLVVYFVLNYSEIRANNSTTNFKVAILPQLPLSQLVPKIMIITCVASFNPGSSAIFHSMRFTPYKRAIVPVIVATLTTMVVFVLIGVLGSILFGELILSQDSLIKVLYIESNSLITPFTQFLFSLIAIYHSPAYVFSSRESILSLFNRHFSWAQSDTYFITKTQFPKMYERVPRWLFYSVSFVFFALIITITLFLRNLINFLQIVGVPLMIFLNFLFPNLVILKKNGTKREPYALLNIVVSSTAGVLPFLLGLIQAL